MTVELNVDGSLCNTADDCDADLVCSEGLCGEPVVVPPVDPTCEPDDLEPNENLDDAISAVEQNMSILRYVARFVFSLFWLII